MGVVEAKETSKSKPSSGRQWIKNWTESDNIPLRQPLSRLAYCQELVRKGMYTNDLSPLDWEVKL